MTDQFCGSSLGANSPDKKDGLRPDYRLWLRHRLVADATERFVWASASSSFWLAMSSKRHAKQPPSRQLRGRNYVFIYNNRSIKSHENTRANRWNIIDLNARKTLKRASESTRHRVPSESVGWRERSRFCARGGRRTSQVIQQSEWREAVILGIKLHANIYLAAM